jgi:hypothetical protein
VGRPVGLPAPRTDPRKGARRRPTFRAGPNRIGDRRASPAGHARPRRTRPGPIAPGRTESARKGPEKKRKGYHEPKQDVHPRGPPSPPFPSVVEVPPHHRAERPRIGLNLPRPALQQRPQERSSKYILRFPLRALGNGRGTGKGGEGAKNKKFRRRNANGGRGRTAGRLRREKGAEDSMEIRPHPDRGMTDAEVRSAPGKRSAVAMPDLFHRKGGETRRVSLAGPAFGWFIVHRRPSAWPAWPGGRNAGWAVTRTRTGFRAPAGAPPSGLRRSRAGAWRGPPAGRPSPAPRAHPDRRPRPVFTPSPKTRMWN